MKSILILIKFKKYFLKNISILILVLKKVFKKI